MGRGKVIKFRVSDEEYAKITEKAKNFGGKSNYIRSALKEFSNVNAISKLQLMNDLHKCVHGIQNDLSTIAGAMNQTMKRGNELAIGGVLNQSYFDNFLYPEIQKGIEFNRKLKMQLDDIVNVGLRK